MCVTLRVQLRQASGRHHSSPHRPCRSGGLDAGCCHREGHFVEKTHLPHFQRGVSRADGLVCADFGEGTLVGSTQ